MQPQSILITSIVVILWSLNAVSIKYLLGSLDPIELTAITGIVFLVCIASLLIYKRINPIHLVTKLSPFAIFIAAFIGVVGYFLSGILFNVLLRDNESFIIVAMTYAMPILLTTVFSILLLGKTPTKRALAGIILMSCGVVLLVS